MKNRSQDNIINIINPYFQEQNLDAPFPKDDDGACFALEAVFVVKKLYPDFLASLEHTQFNDLLDKLLQPEANTATAEVITNLLILIQNNPVDLKRKYENDLDEYLLPRYIKDIAGFKNSLELEKIILEYMHLDLSMDGTLVLESSTYQFLISTFQNKFIVNIKNKNQYSQATEYHEFNYFLAMRIMLWKKIPRCETISIKHYAKNDIVVINEEKNIFRFESPDELNSFYEAMPENIPIILSSTKHSIGLFKQQSCIQYYESNNRRGELSIPFSNKNKIDEANECILKDIGENFIEIESYRRPDQRNHYFLSEYLTVSLKPEHLNFRSEADESDDLNDDLDILAFACQVGDDNTLEAILKSNHNQINLDNPINDQEFTYLHIACLHNHAQSARQLLLYHADPNCSDTYERTPLLMVVQYSMRSFYKILLQHDANPHALNREYESAIGVACAQGDLYFLKLYLQKYSLQDYHNNFHNEARVPSLIQIACKNKNIYIVDLLLKNGEDVNGNKEAFASPLILATQNQDYATMGLLIQNHALLTLKNIMEQTALDLAINAYDIAACQILMHAAEMQKLELSSILSKTNIEKLMQVLYSDKTTHSAQVKNTYPVFENKLENKLHRLLSKIQCFVIGRYYGKIEFTDWSLFYDVCENHKNLDEAKIKFLQTAYQQLSSSYPDLIRNTPFPLTKKENRENISNASQNTLFTRKRNNTDESSTPEIKKKRFS